MAEADSKGGCIVDHLLLEEYKSTRMKYHLTLVIMATIKDLQTINAAESGEKREPFCSVGGNVN